MTAAPRAGSLVAVVVLALALPACDSGGADGSCASDSACDPGSSCVSGACAPGERCGATVCDPALVCDGASTCVASPYDQDFELVLVGAQSSPPGRLSASLTLGRDTVLTAGPTPPVLSGVASWNAHADVHVAAWEPFTVVLTDTLTQELIRETLPRVPYALLATGELTLEGAASSLTLRAYPAATAPECFADDECAPSQHCAANLACVAGEPCGASPCATGEICGAGACVASPYDAAYTLTLVSATMASGNWDSGFDTSLPPDPRVTVFLDGDPLLVGPEVENTHNPTWSGVSATATFGPYTPVRVLLEDVDVQGSDVAVDTTYPRLPYELVRDGTFTVSSSSGSVTLTLAPAASR